MVAAFSSLPLEVKADIFSFVAWREEAWRKRKKKAGKAQQELATNGRVDGVKAVSLVCKEWRMLAGKHLFRCLSDRDANRAPFRYLIHQRYGHCFSEASLHGSAATQQECVRDLDYFLSILPTLVNIDILSITHTSAKNLFGADLMMDPEREGEGGLRVATFIQVLRNIKSIHLWRFPTDAAAQLLSLRLGAQLLSIRGARPVGSNADMSPLVTVLAGMPHLNLLLIHQTEAQLSLDPTTWTSEALASLRNSPPPISTIYFTTSYLTAAELSFIALFSSTLNHLSLTIQGLSSEIMAMNNFRMDLPFLVSLHVHLKDQEKDRTKVDFAGAILRIFSSSPLVSVSITDDEGFEIAGIDVCGATLYTLANCFPTLRQLRLSNGKFIMKANELQHISTFCAERQIRKRRTATQLWHTVDEGREMLQEEHIAQVCEELDYLLEYGKMQVERLRQGSRVEDARGLITSLKPLHAHRQEWED
ncbi:hypothetical protein P7C70_g2709, partial [Phenoliferia sp. Uapishka_3]